MNSFIGLILIISLWILFIKKDYENFCPSPVEPKIFALKIKPYHVVKTRPRYERDMYCYSTSCPNFTKKKDQYSCWKCHIKW